MNTNRYTKMKDNSQNKRQKWNYNLILISNIRFKSHYWKFKIQNLPIFANSNKNANANKSMIKAHFVSNRNKNCWFRSHQNATPTMNDLDFWLVKSNKKQNLYTQKNENTSWEHNGAKLVSICQKKTQRIK